GGSARLHSQHRELVLRESRSRAIGAGVPHGAHDHMAWSRALPQPWTTARPRHDDAWTRRIAKSEDWLSRPGLLADLLEERLRAAPVRALVIHDLQHRGGQGPARARRSRGGPRADDARLDRARPASRRARGAHRGCAGSQRRPPACGPFGGRDPRDARIFGHLRLIPLRVVDELMGGVVLITWRKLKPWAELERQRSGSQKTWE